MADNVRRINQVPEFTTPKKDKSKTKSEAPFKFDGVPYVLLRPKMVIAMTMLRLAEGEEMSTETEMGLDMVRLLSSLLGYIKKEAPSPEGDLRGQAHLMHRLSDVNDDLDLTDLAGPFQELIGKLFERPTGKPAASSQRPARTSRAGGGSTRSKRAASSTN